MDSLTFLEKASRTAPQPIYVLTGDEDFLKHQARAAIKALVLAGGDEAFGLSVHPGDEAQLATIRDDLDTLPFLGKRRLVIVENADPFVSAFRGQLEKYVGKPSATGVLLLEVRSWSASTRLAKMISGDATIVCQAPAAAALPKWCVQRAAEQHHKQLTRGAADLLVELVGAEMGLLDQELTKLATYAGDAARIDEKVVDLLVGRSQGTNAFKILDAVGGGRPGAALAILDRLFEQGEDPHRILGALSSQLRRLAQAGRLSQHGVPLTAALSRVGVRDFAIRGAEQQVRYLGRRRLDRLYDWLLEIDLALKSSSQLSPRLLLERLLVRLARPREN